MSLAIVWLRRDLRTADSPALANAAAAHSRVLPVYIHSPVEEAPWQAGAASHWWLHHALSDLQQQLDGRLLLRCGDSLEVLVDLVTQTDAAAVYWNRQYEPAAIARDTRVKQGLRERGIAADSGNAGLMFEPWTISNKQGKPFRVFTPFWKHLLAEGLPQRTVDVPDLSAQLVGERELADLGGATVDSLGLLPTIAWDGGIADAWHATRAGAEARLDEFLETELRHYAQGRDLPAEDQVSRLSPYLHFGQIGPREIVVACRRRGQEAHAFLRELGWREFAYYQLYHFPHTADAPMDARFERFPWRDNAQQLAAWQRGRTGIPLVDAGMRQLWHTGWMHNRVRMIVASFLTKNLLLPWQDGARWFWDTLVDADLASNSLGWQWTAGSGADAAPYFRVFNPALQGEKFDRNGEYVRRWVPELADLPDKWIHKPWEAPASELRSAGIRLGRDYPEPLVDLKATRLRALDAWGEVKSG
jgi:deoxyribodipyrimidine photo-lyase